MTTRVRLKKIFALTFILFSGMAWPPSVLAVQFHGGAEGLVSHQIGHLLFLIGMVYLLVKVYQERNTSPGWWEFRGFIWCIILWNILTFCGHWMDEFTNPKDFALASGHKVSFRIDQVWDILFYFTRLDHLLLIPAIFLLLLALKKWRQT